MNHDLSRPRDSVTLISSLLGNQIKGLPDGGSVVVVMLSNTAHWPFTGLVFNIHKVWLQFLNHHGQIRASSEQNYLGWTFHLNRALAVFSDCRLWEVCSCQYITVHLQYRSICKRGAATQPMWFRVYWNWNCITERLSRCVTFFHRVEQSP